MAVNTVKVFPGPSEERDTATYCITLIQLAGKFHEHLRRDRRASRGHRLCQFQIIGCEVVAQSHQEWRQHADGKHVSKRRKVSQHLFDASSLEGFVLT
jgi:hypothetical protein